MRTWLITGISRGLGRALAEAALARGDAVVGTVRDGRPDFANPERLHVLPFEAADPAAAEATIARAFELAGRLDVLVNNAGYGLLGAVEDAQDGTRSPLRGEPVRTFRLIRAALPRLHVQGSGHIVNVTSIAGRAPMAGSGLYAAAKAGLEGLSKALAQEVAPLGLRVTAVAPGGFRTDFLSAHSVRRSAEAPEAYAGSVGAALGHLDAVAGRQLGDPARAAAAILRLVDAGEPPLHLLLGSDALRRARAECAAVAAGIKGWEDVTLSTDHPAGA